MKQNVTLKKRTSKRAKGFTLVELVVVIAIISVLAAMIVPNFISYIRMAKCKVAIADAKTIVTGVESSLMDKYISNTLVIKRTNNSGTTNIDKKMTINGTETLVGGLTNTSLSNNTKDSPGDLAVASSVRDILLNANLLSGNAPSGNSGKPFGENCKTYLKNIGSNYAFVIIYSSDGTIPLMQIYRNGILVTYADGTYVANDSKDAKFLNKGDAISKAFADAGMAYADMSDYIKKTKFPSTW
jgi:prepilin-type N-terminal cleavage/methylation domain-containing protein